MRTESHTASLIITGLFAVIAFVGCLLPWASVNIGLGVITFAGYESDDGKVCMGLSAIAIIALFVCHHIHVRWASMFASLLVLIMGLATAFIAFFSIRWSDEIFTQAGFTSGNIGGGPYIILFGGGGIVLTALISLILRSGIRFGSRRRRFHR